MRSAGCLYRTRSDARYTPFVPTLVGFAVLGASFYKTRSIIIPTLLSALAYGLAWKVMAIIYPQESFSKTIHLLYLSLSLLYRLK
ncbi:putative inner membrane protein [Escherichia coli]|uniref:Putative inner membrane protein n=1 Tax=Escherichia coli TaxID=562 RepID=A0A376RED6_ECOLX|nr:putative inner membrane protein [Escherichia coli]